MDKPNEVHVAVSVALLCSTDSLSRAAALISQFDRHFSPEQKAAFGAAMQDLTRVHELFTVQFSEHTDSD